MFVNASVVEELRWLWFLSMVLGVLKLDAVDSAGQGAGCSAVYHLNALTDPYGKITHTLLL